MHIRVASDHAGFELKGELLAHLVLLGHEVVDMGDTVFDDEDDYPDFCIPLAKEISGTDSVGIVIGGSGQGEAMAANRVSGVRACVYYGGLLNIVKLSREHNNANVLSLGARFLSADEAKEAVDVFLDTAFSGDERHVRRIAKLDA